MEWVALGIVCFVGLTAAVLVHGRMTVDAILAERERESRLCGAISRLEEDVELYQAQACDDPEDGGRPHGGAA